MTAAKTWRGFIPFMGPKWFTKDFLREPDGTETEVDSRSLYAVMSVFDAFTSMARRAARATMPGLAPEDALAYIGQARRVFRGPEESADGYVERLIRAIDDWRIAGVSWSILEQLRGYCSPHAVRVRIFNNHGNCYTIDRDGSRSIDKFTAWDWDGSSSAWSRFWVLIYPTTGTPKKPWDRSAVWGTAGNVYGTEGRTWGSTATPADVFAIRRIVRTWKPAGSTCVHIMVVFDDTAFDPASAAPPLPDGTWHDYGRYGVTPGRKTRARSSDAIYWRGTA